MRSPVTRLDGGFRHNVNAERLLTPIREQRLYPRRSSSHAPHTSRMNQGGVHRNCACGVLPSSGSRPLTPSRKTKGAPQGIGLRGWRWRNNDTSTSIKDVEVSQRGALRRRVGIDNHQKSYLYKPSNPDPKNLSNESQRPEPNPCLSQSPIRHPTANACPAADRQLNPTIEGYERTRRKDD